MKTPPMPVKTCDAFINKSARVTLSTVWACSVMPSHVCQAMFIRNIKSGWLNLAYRQDEQKSMSFAHSSMTVNRLRPCSMQNAQKQPLEASQGRTTGRLGANMRSRGSNREMEEEERHKHSTEVNLPTTHGQREGSLVRPFMSKRQRKNSLPDTRSRGWEGWGEKERREREGRLGKGGKMK